VEQPRDVKSHWKSEASAIFSSKLFVHYSRHFWLIARTRRHRGYITLTRPGTCLYEKIKSQK